MINHDSVRYDSDIASMNSLQQIQDMVTMK